MKFKMVLMATLLSCFSIHSIAAGDAGKIIEVYAHPSGQMALKLDNGFPNGNAENNCGSPNNQWAGIAATADSSLKSAILAAKATQSLVIVVTLGNCQGGWLQIEALHVK